MEGRGRNKDKIRVIMVLFAKEERKVEHKEEAGRRETHFKSTRVVSALTRTIISL